MYQAHEDKPLFTAQKNLMKKS